MFDKPHSEPMSYGIEKRLKSYSQLLVNTKLIFKISEMILKQQKELQEKRIEKKKAKAELTSSRY